MGQGVRVLSSRSLYKGRVLSLKLDRVIEPGGVKAFREVVEHPGSVVVIPRLPNGDVILVRQYRYAARKRLWELIAGSMEPGESVLRAARRELREEAGYKARFVRRVLSFYSSPGFLTERMHLVEASGLTLSKAEPEADERIRVGAFSKTQLEKLLRDRKIVDGKTLVGLLWVCFKQGAGSVRGTH